MIYDKIEELKNIVLKLPFDETAITRKEINDIQNKFNTILELIKRRENCGKKK